MKTYSSFVAALLLAASAVPAGAATLGTTPLPRVHRSTASSPRSLDAVTQATAAAGVGLNLDVVGRLQTQSGLVKTAINIANNTNTDTQVDVFFVGKIGGVHRELPVFSVTAAGFVNQGAALMASHSVFHSDDFIDDLHASFPDLITQADVDAGVLGSLFVIYNAPSPGSGLFEEIGQGTVQGRFYADQCGGTVGFSANGHEITISEPTKLVGIARYTIGEAGVPQVYTNFVVNNEGFADDLGNLHVNPVTIQLTGFSNSTGLQLPNQPTFAIGNYETIVIGGPQGVFGLVGGNPAVDDSIVVVVKIISGTSAISGLSTIVDFDSKGPDAAPLRNANWTAGGP